MAMPIEIKQMLKRLSDLEQANKELTERIVRLETKKPGRPPKEHDDRQQPDQINH